MTSQGDIHTIGDQRLHLDSGDQALVAHDSLHPSVSLLPPGAYQNLLVVSPRPASAVARQVTEAGGNLNRVGHLPLVSSEQGYDGPMWTAPSVDPSDLTGLSMQYARALGGLTPEHGWVLFDDFNTLLAYNDADRVVKLLTHLTQQTSEREIRGVYTVVRDAMDDETFARLQNIVERDIDVR
jgi:hypothetical protein